MQDALEWNQSICICMDIVMVLVSDTLESCYVSFDILCAPSTSCRSVITSSLMERIPPVLDHDNIVSSLFTIDRFIGDAAELIIYSLYE